MEFPILESQRIILRELNECDLLSLFDIYSDQKAMKYWDSTTHNDISETSIMLQNKQKSWHNNIGISWAIELKKTKQLIGQITIHNWQKETHLAKLGYIINPGFWGQGLATETLKTVINFGLGKLGLKNILAEIDPENCPSAAVLEKNGFRFIKTIKNDLMKNGLYYDSNVYQLRNTINEQ